MYTIRNFTDKDLEFVQPRDFILWLQIQYSGDFDKNNCITAVDENENVCGVAALEYHGSWYCKCKNNLLNVNLCADNDDVLDILIKGVSSKAECLQKENPDKKVGVITFVPDNAKEHIQNLLHSGFCFAKAVSVLGYELSRGSVHHKLPEGVTIEQVGKDNDSIDEYIAATGLANDNMPDSKNEYLFRAGDESFLSFRAVYGGKTIGGITVWNMGEDGGATENIFTIPEFRQQGIASELIATAFDELSKRGRKLATLSMLGDNAKAMKLYQGIGYKFIYNLFMMKLD